MRLSRMVRGSSAGRSLGWAHRAISGKCRAGTGSVRRRSLSARRPVSCPRSVAIARHSLFRGTPILRSIARAIAVRRGDALDRRPGQGRGGQPPAAGRGDRPGVPAAASTGLEVGHRLDGFEVVVVDDGSTDETAEVLRRLAGIYPELRPVSLAKNVGQSAATVAGFRAARGDWVGLLDADLQNPPADLAATLGRPARVRRGPGLAEDARGSSGSRRVISRLANRVRNVVLGQSIRDTGCSVRIFPREVALRLPMFRGVHRFFGPLLIREGCRIVQMPVGHRPRTRREVALPLRQSVDPGGRRPARGRLAAPAADPVRGRSLGGSPASAAVPGWPAGREACR